MRAASDHEQRATWGAFPLDMNRHLDLAPVDTELAITPQPSRASHTLPPGQEPARSLGALTASASSKPVSGRRVVCSLDGRLADPDLRLRMAHE